MSLKATVCPHRVNSLPLHEKGVWGRSQGPQPLRACFARLHNALVLNPSGGNVGVGTTAPAAGITLDVAGVIRGTVFTTQYVSVYAGNSTNTFTLTVPYPATYLFTVTGNGAYVGGGGDNYAKAIIYIHIGSSGVLLTTVVQAQGVGINSYTPGTQTLSYNIGTSGQNLQYGGNSTVSITRLG